jgi:hypothetical protein
MDVGFRPVPIGVAGARVEMMGGDQVACLVDVERLGMDQRREPEENPGREESRRESRRNQGPGSPVGTADLVCCSLLGWACRSKIVFTQPLSS